MSSQFHDIVPSLGPIIAISCGTSRCLNESNDRRSSYSFPLNAHLGLPDNYNICHCHNHLVGLFPPNYSPLLNHLLSGHLQQWATYFFILLSLYSSDNHGLSQINGQASKPSVMWSLVFYFHHLYIVSESGSLDLTSICKICTLES